MPLWILVFIIFIIFIIIFFILKNKCCFNFIESLFTSIFVVAIIVLIICGIAAENVNYISDEYEEKICNIQGLKNNLTEDYKVNGAFILGCGYVSGKSESDMKYYYFKVDEYGKKLESISGTDVYIRETNDMDPCLIKTYKDYEFNKLFKWLFSESDVIGRTEYKTILVVPENTIKIDYNVDI